MKDLQTGQSIHQVRLSLFPQLEEGRASWTMSTVRYRDLGRIPEIVTEESGQVILTGSRSSWEYAEVLYDVLRQIVRP